ncbi:MAG: hypothetical protein WAK31_02005 [Chthoniobacterales bacterium]
MTGRDKLKELAAARGLSERTARRYHQAGVDLNDPAAVEERKHKIRSRRGVSKFWHRQTVQSPPATFERLVDVIWNAYHLAIDAKEDKREVDPNEILDLTGPLITAFLKEGLGL